MILIIPVLVMFIGCCSTHTPPLSSKGSSKLIAKAIRNAYREHQSTGSSSAEYSRKVISFGIFNAGITDLQSMTKLTELKHLDLSGNHIANLTPLKGLTKLEHLNLSYGNKITDLTPLFVLTNLNEIVFSVRGGSECIPFPQNPNLTWAEVHKLRTELPNCKIIREGRPTGKWAIESAIWRALDVKQSPGMQKIRQLQQKMYDLWQERSDEQNPSRRLELLSRSMEFGQEIEAARREIENSYINSRFDKLPKSELLRVTSLDLHYSHINDLEPLAGLTQLTGLDLGDNQLTDVTGLEKLTQLKTLILDGNQLTNVKGLENLTNLTELDLSSNKLTDVKGLKKLTNLEYLDLRYNNITDISALTGLTKLKRILLGGQPAYTGTFYSKAQLVKLQKALPNCYIGRFH